MNLPSDGLPSTFDGRFTLALYSAQQLHTHELWACADCALCSFYHVSALRLQILYGV